MNKRISIRFDEIFDRTDKFYKTMVGVFTAREDIINTKRILELVDKESDKGESLFTLFKLQIGIFKECSTLIYCNLFKDNGCEDCSYKRIQSFANISEIECYKEKLDNYEDKLLKKYKTIRDYSFHYNNEDDKSRKVLNPFFDNISDFDTTIEINGDILNYSFVYDVYYRYYVFIMNNCTHCENVPGEFNELIGELTEIITIIFDLLDSICNGYLSNNKHFEEQIQKCNNANCSVDE